MARKIISFDFAMSSSDRDMYTNKLSEQRVYTNDHNSVELEFRITDVVENYLPSVGATAMLYIYMADGSFFVKYEQHVKLDGNRFYYVLNEEEVKRSGMTKVQLIIKIGNIENASPLFDFKIINGLVKYPIREVEIRDWDALTAEARAFVENVQDLSAEEFVKLEMDKKLINLEKDYAGRLTNLETTDKNFTAQLAQKVTKGGNEQVNMAMLSPDIKQALNDGDWSFNVNTSEIESNSITHDKVDFIINGKNLFNKDSVVSGHIVSHITGELQANSVSTVSEFIPVLPNTQYTRTTDSYCAFYNSNKGFIGGLAPNTGDFTFTTPSDCFYVRVAVVNGDVSTFQLELGGVATDYQSYALELVNAKVKKELVDSRIIQQLDANSLGNFLLNEKFIVGKNLFNKDEVKLNVWINKGVEMQNEDYATSDYIRAKPLTDYTFNHTAIITQFKSNGEYILHDSLTGGNHITTHKETTYLRASILKYYSDVFQLEEGTTPTSYAQYKETMRNIDFTTDIHPLNGKKILFMGDSNTHLNDYNKQIANRTGAVTFNGGFGGTRLLDNTAGNTSNYNKLNGCAISDAIVTGDWSNLESIAQAIDVAENQNSIPKYVGQLNNIITACENIQELDAIVVTYGTNDVSSDNLTLGESDSLDITTWNGAINYFTKRILEVYPHIRIYFTSPVFRLLMPYSVDRTGSMKNSDEWSLSGTKLSDMADAMSERCKANHVPFLDLYNKSGINKYTAVKFLKPAPPDGTHYTLDGSELVGRLVENFLINN